MFRLLAFTSWGYSKDFPRFAARPFRARFKNLQLQPCHSEERSDEESLPVKQETLRSPALERTQYGASAAQGDTRFIEELTTLGGHVIQTKGATKSVVEFLQSHEIDHILLEPNTLDESILDRAGITFASTPDPEINVGVTKAICGLADTGSILIVDAEGSPLHASLLPRIHIAVLRKSTILPSLENALSLIRESNAAVFITGPSRTADIEMTLTIGVHGPGELHVFLVDD